jgi:hypothetical protein
MYFPLLGSPKVERAWQALLQEGAGEPKPFYFVAPAWFALEFSKNRLEVR